MSQFRWPCVAALVALGSVVSSIGPSVQADDVLGRKLFVDRWSAHDKRSPQGDGLGPLHNATSCAACHHQAGAGGGTIGRGGHRFNPCFREAIWRKPEA